MDSAQEVRYCQGEEIGRTHCRPERESHSSVINLQVSVYVLVAHGLKQFQNDALWQPYS